MVHISPVIQSIYKRSWYLVPVFALLSIVLAFALKKIDGEFLKTDNTPNGILSLHLSRDTNDALEVLDTWSSTPDGINAALNSLKLDFGFMMAYGVLLFLIFLRAGIFRLARGEKNYLFVLPAALVVVDILENTLSILFLVKSIEWTYWMRVMSLLKYFLVVLNVVFMRSILRKISDYAKLFFGLLMRFRIVVMSLLVVYLALWHADQGQDLVVSLNTSRVGVVIFFVITTVMAFVHWHLPKFLSKNTSLVVDGEWKPRSLHDWIRSLFFESVVYTQHGSGRIRYVTDSDIARMFGVLTYLIPAFAILNVMEVYKIGEYNANGLLMFSIAIVLFLLDENWIDNAFNSPKYRWLFYAYFAFAITAIIAFAFLNTADPPGLWYLFAALVLQAIAFLILVSIRKSVSQRIRNIKVGPVIMYAALFLALLFIYYNLDPLRLAKNTDINYSTFSVFFSGILFYGLLFMILVLWGRTTQFQILGKRSRINIAGIFIFVAALSAMLFDNRFHDVELITQDVSVNRNPPPLQQYIRGWLRARASEIELCDSTNRYPIVIVNTYGGGIRAAAWTSLAIAHLDLAITERSASKDNFQNHVLAYSGASGGTIGASVMCALRKQNYRIYNQQQIDTFKVFYQKDFLSPVIAGLIGRDFFASTLGTNWEDRARLQSRIWEEHMADVFGDTTYRSSIYAVWNGGYHVPLLFANTTQVEGGLKGVVAPVMIGSDLFPTAIPVSELIYNHEDTIAAIGRPQSMKLSTAAFMSARFPFISPAGRINDANHFLDGGIYENSGAETAGELSRVLEKCIDPAIRSKVKIIILSLNSSPSDDPRKESKNLFEIGAPLKALVANVDGNAVHADATNRAIFGSDYYKLNPRRIDPAYASDSSYSQNTAILPLGWQLSRNALNRLEESLTTSPARNIIDSLAAQFHIPKDH